MLDISFPPAVVYLPSFSWASKANRTTAATSAATMNLMPSESAKIVDCSLMI
jgi:hypothetical protein